MKSEKVQLNILYAAVQAVFWMACCPIVGFGAAYLLDLGFTSADVGIMLGASNVFAAIIQPMLSARSDADERFSPIRIAAAHIVIVLASSLAQALFLPRGLTMVVLWMISATFAISANVFVTAISFQIDDGGVVDFGLGRAMGSLAWASTSAAMGFAVERFGMHIVPVSAFVASLVFLVLLVICTRTAQAHGESEFSKVVAEVGEASTWPRFIRENAWLMVLLFGISLVYLHHCIASYFSFVVVENVGGDASDMGLIIALAAALEIPGMVLFSHIEKRFSAKKVLTFSIVMFTAKSIAIWLAANVAQLAWAYSLQLFSYGFFISSSVAFASQAVRKSDLVKSQACFSLVTTVSGIVSSFAGGALIDTFGVSATLCIVAVCAVAGLVISLVSLPRLKD